MSDYIFSGRQYVYYLFDCESILNCPRDYNLEEFMDLMSQRYNAKMQFIKLNNRSEFRPEEQIQELKRKINIQMLPGNDDLKALE